MVESCQQGKASPEGPPGCGYERQQPLLVIQAGAMASGGDAFGQFCFGPCKRGELPGNLQKY
jgi:hypothetical protein